MVLTSIDNDKVKLWKKLGEKKFRDQHGLYIVEGLHLVLEAFKANAIEELILEEHENFPLDVTTTYVSMKIIKHISHLDTPAPIMAVCRKSEEKEIGSKVLLLDNIGDPGNLGAIIRSAVAFHIDTIVLSNDTVDLYNDKVIRSSQGMLFHINIIRRDLIDTIQTLKEQGINVYGTKVTHGHNVKELNNTSNYALVMGNEGQGVKNEILDLCDEYLYIKMNDKCESLNVAVACSIIMYQLGE